MAVADERPVFVVCSIGARRTGALRSPAGDAQNRVSLRCDRRTPNDGDGENDPDPPGSAAVIEDKKARHLRLLGPMFRDGIIATRSCCPASCASPTDSPW